MNKTSPVFSQIDSFEAKAFRLVEMVNAGRQRILALEQEKIILESELVKLADQLGKYQNERKQSGKMANNSPKEFSKPTNIHKIVNNKRNDAGTTAELKQQLTAYIDELDRCIAYLSDLS